MPALAIVLVVVALLLVLIIPSIRVIGATETGLVRKRYGRRLPEDNPIGFKGEAGYQAELLYPGWRFKFWITYSVEKFPWVQIPAGEIGVVYAQAGKPLPVGAKSAILVASGADVWAGRRGSDLSVRSDPRSGTDARATRNCSSRRGSCATDLHLEAAFGIILCRCHGRTMVSILRDDAVCVVGVPNYASPSTENIDHLER